MSTVNLEAVDGGSQQPSSSHLEESKGNQDSQQQENAQQQPEIAEEENKDGFVIVDNTYLDSVSEMHPLSNLSDFTRVNPMTASTDFKHLASMPSTFLIGPQFKPKLAGTNNTPRNSNNQGA